MKKMAIKGYIIAGFGFAIGATLWAFVFDRIFPE